MKTSLSWWDPIEQEWTKVLRAIPHPVAPHQPVLESTPRRELPTARDDFTRDSESTGA